MRLKGSFAFHCKSRPWSCSPQYLLSIDLQRHTSQGCRLVNPGTRLHGSGCRSSDGSRSGSAHRQHFAAEAHSLIALPLSQNHDSGEYSRQEGKQIKEKPRRQVVTKESARVAFAFEVQYSGLLEKLVSTNVQLWTNTITYTCPSEYKLHQDSNYTCLNH